MRLLFRCIENLFRRFARRLATSPAPPPPDNFKQLPQHLHLS
eukprot:SAG31_NODE_32963_length_349_cov_1.364000_1_plen_41_part_01